MTFDVEEVLAGAVPDPFVVVDLPAGCGAFQDGFLEPGERLLVSLGPGRHPDEPDHVGAVLVWRSVPRGWEFAYDAPWAADDGISFPPEALAATTREAIVDLVGGPALPASPSGRPPGVPEDDVDWTPVEGLLGGAVPVVEVSTETPLAWDGRFWALERQMVVRPTDDTRDAVSWEGAALWRSASGLAWAGSSVSPWTSSHLTSLP